MPHRRVIAHTVRPGDVVEDDSGDARRVARVEAIGREVVLHDGWGDALIVAAGQPIGVHGWRPTPVSTGVD